MSILESIKSTSEDGVDIGKKYIDASYEYSKLKTFQILTYSLSTLSKLFLIGGLLSTGLIFLSVAGAVALGDYLNNMSLGYLFTGLFLMIIGLLIYILRKRIDKKIIIKMSAQFFDSKK
ncbi:hypothetical protein [Polaribacter porphyrae]|uniref:Competence protein n=1 Tax=Polaribacter porphyrae TaxID=1137780 RepID=A0A2S7WTG6_9FLAO|nr:hypothetical protein [Polaribacter porphyrae]PQJ80612.1 hypothetical protein BTO18_16145 [Polaribacter porphyrae]